MPKTAVLLDVDETLIFRASKFNTNLIEALKESDLTEVFLFTRFNIQEEEIYLSQVKLGAKTRQMLISELEENGIKVLGVITPSDCVDTYPAYIPGATTRDDITLNPPAIGKAFFDFYEDYVGLKRIQLASKKLTAEQQAKFEYISMAVDTSYKEAIDRFGEATVKAQMLQIFLNYNDNLPEDLHFDNILFFDDRFDYRESVLTQVSGQETAKTNLLTTTVSVDKHGTDTKEYYLEAIAKHLQMCAQAHSRSIETIEHSENYQKLFKLAGSYMQSPEEKFRSISNVMYDILKILVTYENKKLSNKMHRLLDKVYAEVAYISEHRSPSDNFDNVISEISTKLGKLTPRWILSNMTKLQRIDERVQRVELVDHLRTLKQRYAQLNNLGQSEVASTSSSTSSY